MMWARSENVEKIDIDRTGMIEIDYIKNEEQKL
jgi:hypothetical protein